jgi:hypothetical protein
VNVLIHPARFPARQPFAITTSPVGTTSTTSPSPAAPPPRAKCASAKDTGCLADKKMNLFDPRNADVGRAGAGRRPSHSASAGLEPTKVS